MAWTSPETINATTGITTTLEYLSEVTHFWFGRMFMVAVFVIFLFGYLGVRRDDYFGAFAVASYVTFVLGLLGWVVNIVTGLDFAMIIGVAIISSVVLFTQRER